MKKAKATVWQASWLGSFCALSVFSANAQVPPLAQIDPTLSCANELTAWQRELMQRRAAMKESGARLDRDDECRFEKGSTAPARCSKWQSDLQKGHVDYVADAHKFNGAVASANRGNCRTVVDSLFRPRCLVHGETLIRNIRLEVKGGRRGEHFSGNLDTYVRQQCDKYNEHVTLLGGCETTCGRIFCDGLARANSRAEMTQQIASPPVCK